MSELGSFDLDEFLDAEADATDVAAVEALRSFFRENAEEVFYQKQLQVRFERHYFHWVTVRALKQLVEDKVIATRVEESASGRKFRVFHARSFRFNRLRVRALGRLIDQMSDQTLTEACGNQAETLFLAALAERGFVAHGRDVNRFRGRQWTETGENLDYIVERDGIAYGCEVKNTWDYIPPEELTSKIRLCLFLGIRPLFIMRFAPKIYMKEILDAGGFGLLFVAHIYPFGMREFARQVAGELGVEADSPRRIPDGIIDRFERWHRRQM